MSDNTTEQNGPIRTTANDETFQNRDILKWMDRVKRSALFTDDSLDLIEAVDAAIGEGLKEKFRELFREKMDGMEPSHLIADVTVKPPVSKKILPEGEKHAISWKEYPTYFFMAVVVRFTITASDEKMAKSPSYYSEWYNALMASDIENWIRETVESKLTPFLGHLVRFPTKAKDFVAGTIDVVPATALSVTLKGGSFTRDDVIPHRRSDDYREMLLNETSMAFARLVKPDSAEEGGSDA